MKRLGKIASVKFGKGGYQDVMFGLTVGFEFGGGDTCVDDSNCHYLPGRPGEGKHEERREMFTDRMLAVAAIMETAKVDDIGRLRGIPIEAEFEGNVLQSWRVLTEVI